MRIRSMVSLVFLGLVGCSDGGDPVIVSVGDLAVHADEFRHRFQKAAAADSSLLGDVAGRMKLAEALAEELLYEHLFRDLEGEFDEVRADRVLDFQERRMVEYLRSVEYGDAARVSEEELAHAYEKLGTRRHLRRMVLESEAKAIEIRRAVLEGGLFDRVAMQVSLDERTREIGGDIGWVTYPDLPPLERDEVWATPVGEVSQPVSGGAVFALYQVLEEDENRVRGTLEAERPRLELGIAQRKTARAVERYRKDLFDRANFRTDPAQVAWLTVHLHEKTAPAIRGTAILDDPETEQREGYALTRGQIPWTGPPVQPADTSRVLATYDPDQTVKPLLVIDQLVSTPIPTWPTFDKADDVVGLIRDLVLERLEQAEAYRRGYENAPGVVYEIRERERDVKRRQVLRNQLRRPAIPTAEEVREEYERRIEEFTAPEARRFVAINTATREGAERASGMLRAGRPIEEIMATFGEEDRAQTTGPAGTPPITEGDSPALDDVIFALELGEVSDPVPVGETFTVAKVIQILPSVVDPFEDVRVDLQVEMVDRAIEPLQRQMLEEGRAKYPTQIDVAALRSIEIEP